MHGTPPISRENGHIETGFNNQSQTVLESRGLQNEDGSQCTGLSQADGSGDISDQAAAETLVHFRDQISHEANQNRVTINGDIRQHEQSMPYSSTGFWQQRPGNSMGVNQQQTVQYTQASGYSVQNDNVSMDINLQNVIVNMSRTLSSIQQKQDSIQQKQDSIQQKQDSMQQKQELFESAFQSVVAVLQEMRSVSLTNNQREASSVPARPALPNELPQNPNGRWCQTVQTLANLVKETVLFHTCKRTYPLLCRQRPIVAKTPHMAVVSIAQQAITTMWQRDWMQDRYIEPQTSRFTKNP